MHQGHVHARPDAKEIAAIRSAVSSFTLLAALAAAPIAAENPRLREGQQLYAANCQACHGATAKEGAGGNIRGLPQTVLARAVRSCEEMPAVDLSEAEFTAIRAYLKSLHGG